MKLRVTRPHEYRPQELRRQLENVEERLQEKYLARTSWTSESTMSIGAPGVRGQLEYDENEVRVELEVSAALLPLRKRIEKELGRELDRVVAA